MARQSGAKARRARRARQAKRADEARLAAKRSVPGGASEKRWGKLRGTLGTVAGVLVLLVVIGGSVTLTYSQLLEEVWRDFAPQWPGGVYGFAASAGLVGFPCAAGVVVGLGSLVEDVSRWRRSRGPRHIAQAVGHGVLAAVSGLLGAVGLVVVTTTLGGKGTTRSDSLSVFLRSEYPWIAYAALGGIMAVPAAASAAVKLQELLKRRRRGTAAPSAERHRQPRTRKRTTSL
jgi:hypothetical protein